MNNIKKRLEKYSETIVHNKLFNACKIYKDLYLKLEQNLENGITHYCDGYSDACKYCIFYLIKDLVAENLEQAFLYGIKEDTNNAD